MKRIFLIITFIIFSASFGVNALEYKGLEKLSKKNSFMDDKGKPYSIEKIVNKKFYYIGALGSKKTHTSRCERLKQAGFSDEKINSIHGPIGIKLGGKSAPEIALSIIAQLVSETYQK